MLLQRYVFMKLTYNQASPAISQHAAICFNGGMHKNGSFFSYTPCAGLLTGLTMCRSRQLTTSLHSSALLRTTMLPSSLPGPSLCEPHLLPGLLSNEAPILT